jgi:hypothetical protein
MIKFQATCQIIMRSYCDQLRDLSLRERRACFNNYLSTVPGFHKVRSSSSAAVQQQQQQEQQGG